jgi:hypothetical protein
MFDKLSANYLGFSQMFSKGERMKLGIRFWVRFSLLAGRAP